MSDDSLNPVEPTEDYVVRTGETIERTGPGFAWGAMIIFVALALLVVFAIQNNNPVPVEFLWLDGEYSLALVILITVAVVVLLVELFGLLYRRRRRKRVAERQELKRFRDSS